MKQAIAGVAPSSERETTNMVVWPTIAAGGQGRFLGRLYSIRLGVGTIFTLGNFLALASIPHALFLFFWNLLPGVARRYRLTNRRVIIERKLLSWRSPWQEESSVGLDRFDQVVVEVLPGQAWYPAGDLVFYEGPVEHLRLRGVSRPETFRRTLLKARQSYVGVQQVQQAAMG